MMTGFNRTQGFTLVEAIVSILLLAVISIGITQFIGFSSEGYQETSERNRLSASARVAIERMAMELHNALPNSVRISADLGAGDQCLEFLPILSASTYIDPPFKPAPSTTTISVVEFRPEQTSGSGGFAVIYPRKQSDLYQNLPFENPGHIVEAGSILAHATLSNVVTVTLSPTHTFSRRSPEDRIYLVDDPVSFCVDGNRLYRYQGYDITADQPLLTGSPSLPTSTATGRAVLATDLDNDGYTAFDQLAATLRRNAIVQFEFNFSSEGESITMNHEVMLHSAP